jgi:hypothetical protein
MSDVNEVVEGVPPPLGTAVSFFQCGQDLSVQATPEGLRRLATVMNEVADSGRTGTTAFRYRNPHDGDEGTFTIEAVEAFGSSGESSESPKPSGRNYVVPVVSVIGAVWMLVLPLVGLGAIIWFVVRWLVGAP